MHRAILLPFALSTLFAFCASPFVVAQSSGHRTINVTGEAEVRAVPDEAVFNFGIVTFDSTDIDRARQDNDRRLTDLLALVRRLGIDDKFVQTDFLSIEPRYEYETEGWRRKEYLIGYATTRNLSVTLRDLTKFEALLAGALKLGVDRVGQAELRTTQMRKYRDEARAQAIRAAREKAAALAAELGAKVGRPILIDESPMWDQPWMGSSRVMLQNSVSDATGEGAASATMALGQIRLNARVRVMFELE